MREELLAFTCGADVYVEILDDARKTGVVMDLLSALHVAADINLETARIMEVLASQLDQGTIPIWTKFIAEWGPHGEGTAEQN